MLFLLFPGVFQSWDRQMIDRLFILRETVHPSPYDSSIVHIDIDNSSIKKLSYYFPRRLHADLFDATRRMGFSAMLYDIIFAQRLNTVDDTLLLESVKMYGNGYFPVAFELKDRHIPAKMEPEEIRYLDSTAWKLECTDTSSFYYSGATLLTWPDLANVSRGVGYISVAADPDGVFRRVPLVVRYKNNLYPSMVFRMVCNLLNVPPEHISIDGGTSLTLRKATARDGSLRDIVIPIDDQGNMIINWIGPWERMKHISFVTLLEAATDQDEVDAFAEQYQGSLAFVGDVSTGISDIGPIPFEQSFPLVGLHANTLNTILTENFLHQLPFRYFAMIAVALAILMIFFSYRFSSIVYTVSSVLLLVVFISTGFLLFIYGNTIISLLFPSLAIVLSTSSVLTYRYITEEKEKEQLRARFESYFPPAVVKQMLENPDSLMTKPQSREITIMFSDIKSFTTHSSKMTPEEISAALSEYFEAMTSIVFKYEGTVDKFIGDGLMVFYGAPETQDDHALRCVNAAIEMQKKCRELRVKWESEGRFPLQIRIGINTGTVIVGDLGSERRKEYTVIGSDVNLAQRLESNAPVGGILISDSTYQKIQGTVRTASHEPIVVKGLSTATVVHEVIIE
ncbi:MAG: adenylate/guanylate cyclase domain-containing protein [Bacteroidetes bacterium]|nr:adenylate/guanylate cyclase domain-containing protein [Bacteroidota bacterium]